jgi:hypothetical protein
VTESYTLGVAAVALAIAIIAGWLSLPRPPELDGERWFKVVLCTLLRGQAEADDAGEEGWVASVLRFVPYHPAGRLPEQKVLHPTAWCPPGALLDGELALLERLGEQDNVSERWRVLYEQDEAGLVARLDDPHQLGERYDPSTVFGPQATWDALAEWAPAFVAEIDRRDRSRWVLCASEDCVGPSLIAPLVEVLGTRAEVHAWTDGEPDALAEALRTRIRAQIPEGSDRLVLVAEGTAIQVVLRALVDAVDIRDRVGAVLSIGGNIHGRPGDEGPFGEAVMRDWNGAHFTQLHLDTEVVRQTPYLALQWLDREDEALGAGGLGLNHQRFGEVKEDAGSFRMVVPVDLGPLPVDEALPLDLIARALRFVITAWVLTPS